MPDPRLVELLDSGTRRLVRSVDGMSDEQWQEPSLLPGWSRAHVVAHLTLNAEGLAAALEGVHESRQVPMYRSSEARDADIAELARASTSELRDRFLGSTTIKPGRVNVWGTICGVLILAVGISGIQQLGGAFFVEPLFNGTTLVISIALAGFAQRRRSAVKAARDPTGSTAKDAGAVPAAATAARERNAGGP